MKKSTLNAVSEAIPITPLHWLCVCCRVGPLSKIASLNHLVTGTQRWRHPGITKKTTTRTEVNMEKAEVVVKQE